MVERHALGNAALASERVEQKYWIRDSADADCIATALAGLGRRLTFDGLETSRIISAYFESSLSASVGDISVRLRTYLASGYEVAMSPAVVDAKLESAKSGQKKRRQSFPTWRSAACTLSSHVNYIAVMFPESLHVHGNLGRLACDYGVEYSRSYYELHPGLRVTLDRGLRALQIEGMERVARSVDVPGAILEVKLSKGIDNTRVIDAVQKLNLSQLPRSLSKRSLARSVHERLGRTRCSN